MRSCIDCHRGDVELRPYGPGGSLICLDCGEKPARRAGVQAAMRAAFDRVDVAVSLPGLGIVSPEEAARRIRCACGSAPSEGEQLQIARELRAAARVPDESGATAFAGPWKCARCAPPRIELSVCVFCSLPILKDQERASVEMVTRSYPAHAGCAHAVRRLAAGEARDSFEGWVRRIVAAVRESARRGLPPAERERLAEVLDTLRLQLEAAEDAGEICAEVLELVDELSPRLAAAHARQRAMRAALS